MTTSEKFPWHRCAVGESFFIPCLDVQKTLQRGLSEGYKVLGQRANIKGRSGVYAGLLGVLFTVKQQRRRPNTAG